MSGTSSSSASARRTRLAVIGAGAWGANHVRVLASEARCELVAIADPDPAAIARAHAIAPAARRDSVDAILADPQVDALVIASPAPTHAELATAAIAAGKHVLVEKPLALDLASARRVAAALRATDRIAMVGHLMVYHPAVVRLRQLLRSGTLGELHYLHATRANLGRLRSDENALWSFGPHDLSMIDYLLERSPVSVTARGQSVLQPGVEDVVFLTLRYASGELAHLHLSWLHPRKERRLTVVCAQKMLEFDDVSAEKLKIYDKGFDRLRPFTQFAEYLTIRDGDVHIPSIAMEEPLRLEIRHFLDCIERGIEPLTSIASGVRVVAVLEAAEQSLRADGHPVPVPAVND
jgi:predicted dehydrogenase